MPHHVTSDPGLHYFGSCSAISNENIVKETSNAKFKLVLLGWTPCLCLCFVLNDKRIFNTFIITMYGVMNYSLLMPNLVALYSKPNELTLKMNFILRWTFLSVYFN